VGRILLGVSGGIAAYRAVELVRLAVKAGHAVRVIQTPTSERFVGRATFAAVTGAPVLVDSFEPDPARGAFPGDPAPDHDPISHLELVERCDVLAVAPASASALARLAHGMADGLLYDAALASPAPLVLAPAMNHRMWEHPATRANLDLLRERGAIVVDPTEGPLASRGEWGTGRLAEPGDILVAVEGAMRTGALPSAPAEGTGYAPRSLDGLRVLVTAGGTREPIDAVRFVGNRSSGRMGLAVAAEAARRGAEVTVIAANVSLDVPAGAQVIAVETALELERAARAEFPRADVLVMAAAVSDFRPTNPEAGKLAKADRDGLTVDLEPTVDVLAALSGERRPGQTLVGFAAEHGDGASERAREKLARKRLDALVLNDVSRPGIGFDAAENEVTILTATEARPVARAPKAQVAAAVLDAVEELRSRVPVAEAPR
jgi:phosphopantothenoylcysteine decarboxylase/phosphopantothenate--cysteine ligase